MKKSYYVLIVLSLITVIGGGIAIYWVTQENERKNKLLEEQRLNEQLVENDFYTQQRKRIEDLIESEAEAEREEAERSRQYKTPDAYQVNFHSDKKEILPIENIGAEDNSLDVLLTNLLTFFNYYDVSVTKEDLLERIHFEKLYEKDGKLVSDLSPTNACILNKDNELISCFAPYLATIYQQMLQDKQIEKYVAFTSMNLHYSIPDFPIIIWIGTDYLDNPEVFEWYSSDGKEKYTAPKNTHIVLVMGYDKENFYIIDPLKEGVTKVERSILEASYNAYGRQKFFMNFGRAGLFK